MSFELFIALRYFRSKKHSRTFSLMNILTIFGVSLGVFAMIVVLAVMNGLEKDVKEKLLRVTPHVYVMEKNGTLIDDWESLNRKIRTIPHIEAIAPFYLGSALINSGDRTEPVLIKGIFPELEAQVTDVESIMKDGSLEDLNMVGDYDSPGIKSPGKIITGMVLSSKLGLLPDEMVKLIFTPGKNAQITQMIYVGAFETGFMEYDEDLVLLRFDDLQRLFGLDNRITGLQIKLDELLQSETVVKNLQEHLGTGYEIKSWRNIHENLFSAMSLEKKAMSVILFILILTAAFGIAGGVAILIMQKRREIGILKSMGAQSNSVLLIFLIEGTIIGICGILSGGIPGVLFCYFSNKYKLIHVNIDLFGTFFVPFVLPLTDLFIIALGAVIICMIASLFPAWKAAKLDPIQSIRE